MISYKALLINPWIYDFAAYNFWCRPLGLLSLAEALSCYNIEVYLIDTLEGYKKKWFNTGKFPKTPVPVPEPLKKIKRQYGRYGMPEEEFLHRLRNVPKPDVIFITTLMTYWYPGPVRAMELLRQVFPGVPVMAGGIYATLMPEHAKQTLKPEMLWTGPIKESFFESLREFLPGLRRIRDSGHRYFEMGLYEGVSYAAVLTSRGCPFRCTYCGSSIITGGGFVQREPQDVVAEILQLWQSGVQDFAFYDDALLFRAEQHIKPILRELLRRGFTARFHTPNGLHARMLDEELAVLMKRTNFRTIRLSLETVSPERQKATGGKVSSEDITKAVGLLKKAGIAPADIGIYVMYGLPGQPVQEVRESVEFVMGLGVRVHLAEFSPVPDTAEWNVLIEKGIIPGNIDPLLTNNTVFSLLFSGYRESEIRTLKNDVLAYNRKIIRAD